MWHNVVYVLINYVCFVGETSFRARIANSTIWSGRYSRWDCRCCLLKLNNIITLCGWFRKIFETFSQTTVRVLYSSDFERISNVKDLKGTHQCDLFCTSTIFISSRFSLLTNLNFTSTETLLRRFWPNVYISLLRPKLYCSTNEKSRFEKRSMYRVWSKRVEVQKRSNIWKCSKYRKGAYPI